MSGKDGVSRADERPVTHNWLDTEFAGREDVLLRLLLFLFLLFRRFFENNLCVRPAAHFVMFM